MTRPRPVAEGFSMADLSSSAPTSPPRGLRMFLDSAVPGDWERQLPLGIIHGVTTNPLLLERAGQECSVENLAQLARVARDLGAREIQLQTWGRTPAEMIRVGHQLAAIGEEQLTVVIKIPATADGFRTAREMRQEGHSVTMTAVYTPGQILAAASLGAAYAAPYVGRLDDAGQDGPATVLGMQGILVKTGSETRLLNASLRTPEMVVRLAAAGMDTFTFSSEVADGLLESDLAAAAAADFQRAAEAAGAKNQ